tara:strand:+ start:258 stop:461 length:204 start_codon:yes stop_codon:yes gene_type:complete
LNQIKYIVAKLKKIKKPTISVSVVTNVPEATAGSIPHLVSIIGIKVPKNDPKIKFSSKDTEITMLIV